MNKVTLVAVIGSWDGSNNGQYPLLLEYDPKNLEKPFSSSEGWGHGFSGNNFSILSLSKSNIIEEYNRPESMWAYHVLKKSELASLNNDDTAKLLLADFESNKPIIPLHLQSILNKNA
jgi:hypothetical protein